MRISGSCMEWFLAIDAGAAVFILTLWYFWFARYNRRRALAVLHWVQSACAGKGRVLKVRWHGTSRLLAELRFPPHMFDHARVVVRLLPRPVPTIGFGAAGVSRKRRSPFRPTWTVLRA